MHEMRGMGYCGCGETPEMKRVRLVLKRGELLYDVENCSFVEGDIMGDENEHAKHQVFDIGQDGNVNRVTRVMDLAYSECVEMLYPYTKEEIADGQEVPDNVPDAREEYVIEMRLPGGFSMTTVELLKKLVHEYMVCRVLADWMSITNPGSQTKWEEKMEGMKSRIRTSLLSRTGMARRRMKPF